jgi:hypothetical protein
MEKVAYNTGVVIHHHHELSSSSSSLNHRRRRRHFIVGRVIFITTTTPPCSLFKFSDVCFDLSCMLTVVSLAPECAPTQPSPCPSSLSTWVSSPEPKQMTGCARVRCERLPSKFYAATWRLLVAAKLRKLLWNFFKLALNPGRAQQAAYT